MSGYLLIGLILLFVLLYMKSKRDRARAAAQNDEPIASPQVRSRGAAPAFRPGRRGITPLGAWVPPGNTTVVAGRHIPGGMLFVGSRLPALNRVEVEPALIDPSLRVAKEPGATTGTGMDYWPSYSQISPANRAAYLEWLADGRRSPEAYIGYVFLFFYGLERRVLDPEFPCEADELNQITDEVERLLGLYADNHSFQTYAGSFLEDILLPRLPKRPPPDAPDLGDDLDDPSWSETKRAIVRFVNEGERIPGAWAFAWAVSNRMTRFGTPARRCRAEFRDLFMKRYTARFRGGLRVRERKGRTTREYHPASAGFGGSVRVKLTGDDIPRTISDDVPAKLQEFVDECVSALDPYSRWIGRNPGLEHSVAAMALLPADLLDDDRRAALGKLADPIEQALADNQSAAVPGTILLADWPVGTSGKLRKSDFVGMAQLLEKLGYGLEPDVRFGGPKFGPDDTVVVFRRPADYAPAPSASYSGATLFVQLAALVAQADGSVSQEEEHHLLRHVERAMRLPEAEVARIEAHFRWLTSTDPGFGRIKKRLQHLTKPQLASLGEFLVTVAGADASLDPAEIKTLEKIYRRIGLEVPLLYSHIHGLSTGAVTDPGPVPVIPRSKPTEYAIPSEPAAPPASPASVRLNPELIEKKLAQTSAVTALLGEVFDSDDVEETAPATVETVGPAESITGLDAAHSELLRRLAQRPSWPRGDFEAVTAELGLMPEGAFDVVNEAAFDTVDAPLLEDGDPLILDEKVLREMIG